MPRRLRFPGCDPHKLRPGEVRQIAAGGTLRPLWAKRPHATRGATGDRTEGDGDCDVGRRVKRGGTAVEVSGRNVAEPRKPGVEPVVEASTSKCGGPTGPREQRVFEKVSAQAWTLWEERQKMILNYMEDFFFGEGSALPPDFVLQQSK